MSQPHARRNTLLVLAAFITLALTIAACGSTTAAPPATAAAVSSAPAAPATPRPAAPSQADQLAAWVTSPGYTAMKAVQADLTHLSTDADAGDVLATETDGAQLAADAQIAEDSPCPVGMATYAAAMQAYVSAGNDAASGDFTSATVSMDEGNTLVASTTTAISNAGS